MADLGGTPIFTWYTIPNVVTNQLKAIENKIPSLNNIVLKYSTFMQYIHSQWIQELTVS